MVNGNLKKYVNKGEKTPRKRDELMKKVQEKKRTKRRIIGN